MECNRSAIIAAVDALQHDYVAAVRHGDADAVRRLSAAMDRVGDPRVFHVLRRLVFGMDYPGERP